MGKKQITRIDKALKKEKKALEEIEKDIECIKEEVVARDIPHFSKQDVINAFFGALIIGLTFVFKGALVRTTLTLSVTHISLIILSTLFILSIQIYYMRYKKVKDKRQRHFTQFWFKRLITLYLIAMVVSAYLVYIFNIETALGSLIDAAKLIIVISMPCAIGAAVPSLLKKY